MPTKSKILPRLAASLIVVHMLGHGMGHATWRRPEDPKMQEVVDAMLGYKAAFMGATRSMGDYFHGYSLMLFFIFAVSIYLLWWVSGLPGDQKATTRHILLPIGLLYVAFGVIESLCFFPFAAGVSLGAGLLALCPLFLARDGAR